MTAGCQSIVDAIESKYPDLVHDVTGFINELQKINMLNEEKWMFVLLNLDHEMIRRVKQLDSERVKMEGYKHLTDAEKKAIQAEKTELLTSMVGSRLASSPPAPKSYRFFGLWKIFTSPPARYSLKPRTKSSSLPRTSTS